VLGLLLGLVVGCGRIHFDRLDGSPDGGGPDGEPGGDGPADAPVALGPFDPPQPITELDAAGQNDDPSLTGDQLEIIFCRTLIAGNGDIWHATRASVTDPFGTPTAVTELNASGNENTPDISADGLTIYFSSDRGGNVDVWTSTRTTRQDAWGPPSTIVELSSVRQDVGLHVTSDGLRAVLNRDPGGSSIWDLFLATRPTTTAAWGAPVAITELNTSARDSDGWLSPDHLELWFASDETGTAGQRDLWIARRATEAAMFDPPVRVTEVSSTADDVDPWLSPDRRTLVFASTRSGTLSLYVAKR
jgi:hypothetical protein